MDLQSFILIAVVFLIFYQFWHLRAIAEKAVDYAVRYCDKQDLQFISLARVNKQFKAYKGKLDWHITYQLAFTSDGRTEYTGELVCHGKHLVSIELPAYRIDDSLH